MRLTARGWTCLVAGGLWVVAAYAVGEHDLVWPGMFLAALPVVSLLAMLPSAGRARIRRGVPSQPVPATVPASWTMRLRAPGLNLGGQGEVREELAPALGGSWTIAFPLGLTPRTCSFQVGVTPAWRGRHRVGPTQLRLTHPFGMARTVRTLRQQDVLVATPPVYPLEQVRALTAGSSGTHSPVPRAGALGVDDSMLREYQPGDDTRRIHWPTSARVGELMVRREEHALDPAATILVDNRARCYSTEDFDPRLEAAVALAASIGAHLLREGFSLDLADCGGGLDSWDTSSQETGLLLRLTDLARCDAVDLPAPTRNQGGLFVAILGGLGQDDATALEDACRDQRHRWAIVIAGGRDDPSGESLLRQAGWHCLRVAPTTLPHLVWARLAGA
ncbi:MAG: DUF58 domain-containing protein [Propionibacteriaceae bacterium]|jgi:uncharacterized protein (DUF58 family)|nr:DUF58 domain-containing protein [Propionibacteriaceae bacterium]